MVAENSGKVFGTCPAICFQVRLDTGVNQGHRRNRSHPVFFWLVIFKAVEIEPEEIFRGQKWKLLRLHSSGPAQLSADDRTSQTSTDPFLDR